MDLLQCMTKSLNEFLEFYIDVDYSLWLYRLFMPLIITFLLPLVFVALIYISFLMLFIYKLHRAIHRNCYLKKIQQQIFTTRSKQHQQPHNNKSSPQCMTSPSPSPQPSTSTSQSPPPSPTTTTKNSKVIMRTVQSDLNFWEFGRKLVAALWDAHARIYHGYEVCGLENVPQQGPALIVYYHGAIPIDMYYLNSRMLLQRDRLIYTIGDRFLFKLPGWGTISEAFHISPGTVQSCVGILKDGNLLAISPGGVYEAQFGDHYYELLWRNRIGFAKVALEAKVPIIPCFTQNLREGFRQLGIFRNFFLKLYNAIRIPVYPIYGGFPVKFRTYLGKPIEYDESLTPEQLQVKVATALEELINRHQRLPGSILHALLDRFPPFRSKKN